MTRKWYNEYETSEGGEYSDRGFWKPDSGKHVIEVIEDRGVSTMSEGTDDEFEALLLAVEAEGEAQIKRDGKIETVEPGTEMTWSVSVGQTDESKFGQLKKIAEENSGLEGMRLKVLVAGQGRNKSYTIARIAEEEEEEAPEEYVPSEEEVKKASEMKDISEEGARGLLANSVSARKDVKEALE